MLPRTVMEAVTGEAINLPDPKRLIHLQFRRFVDCPICNTHTSPNSGGVHERPKLPASRK